MVDKRPVCMKCDKRMECILNGKSIRYSKNELQKGDMYRCNGCDAEITIELGNPFQARVYCTICDEIFDSVELYYNHIDEVESHDRCSQCHKILSDDELCGHSESHPYGDTTASEFIVTGCKCSQCGYGEEW